MSDPRKRSLPMRDVSILLEQSLAEESFDESDSCIRVCYLRIRGEFCVETTPRTGFAFYFHIENQSDLLPPRRACFCKIEGTLAASGFFFLN